MDDRSACRALAEWVCTTSLDDLPDGSIRNAKMLLASTVASASLGTQVETAQIVRTVVSERWGRRQATPWFEGGIGASVPDTVRLNAMRSSAAASDDSDLRNLLHAGTAVTTSALASAEWKGRDGAETVAAIVLGYEVAARVAEAVTPGFRLAGFHGCIASIFGSTVATAKLLTLDEQRTTHAIALAASTVSGLLRSAEESNSREHQDATAATLGAEVAISAAHGFTGDEGALDGPQGYFEVFGGRSGQRGRETALDSLGQTWALEGSMAIKLVPGGHPFHSTAEAAAAAAAQLGVSPNDVDQICVSAPGLTEVRGPRHPRNLLEMAHSQAYFAAAAVVDGHFTWAHAELTAIQDPRIHRMIERVVWAPSEDIESPDKFRLGARVSIRSRDGRTVTNTVYEPEGSALRGLSWQHLDHKYRCLAPVSGMTYPALEESLSLIHQMETQGSVRPLVQLLALARDDYRDDD